MYRREYYTDLSEFIEEHGELVEDQLNDLKEYKEDMEIYFEELQYAEEVLKLPLNEYGLTRPNIYDYLYISPFHSEEEYEGYFTDSD